MLQNYILLGVISLVVNPVCAVVKASMQNGVPGPDNRALSEVTDGLLTYLFESYDNSDYDGIDITTVFNVMSAEECAAFCLHLLDEGCSGFTWGPVAGQVRCYPKRGIVGQRSLSSLSGAVAGVIQPEFAINNFRSFLNRDYFGSDLSGPIRNVDAPVGCAGMCSSREGCTGFTWVNNEEYPTTCFLKRGNLAREDLSVLNAAVTGIWEPTTTTTTTLFPSPNCLNGFTPFRDRRFSSNEGLIRRFSIPPSGDFLGALAQCRSTCEENDCGMYDAQALPSETVCRIYRMREFDESLLVFDDDSVAFTSCVFVPTTTTTTPIPLFPSPNCLNGFTPFRDRRFSSNEGLIRRFSIPPSGDFLGALAQCRSTCEENDCGMYDAQALPSETVCRIYRMREFDESLLVFDDDSVAFTSCRFGTLIPFITPDCPSSGWRSFPSFNFHSGILVSNIEQRNGLDVGECEARCQRDNCNVYVLGDGLTSVQRCRTYQVVGGFDEGLLIPDPSNSVTFAICSLPEPTTTSTTNTPIPTLPEPTTTSTTNTPIPTPSGLLSYLFELFDNRDYLGVALPSVDGVRFAEDCAAICLNLLDQGCSGFTWSKAAPYTCVPRKGIVGQPIVSTLNDAVAGAIQTDFFINNFRSFLNRDYLGSDLSGPIGNVDTPADCGDMCSSREGCTGFTWVNDARFPTTCFLKRGVLSREGLSVLNAAVTGILEQ